MRILTGETTHLLERQVVCRIELQLAHERYRIASFGHLHIDRSQAVQRHKSNPSELLLVHDFKDLGGGIIVVDDHMEQTAPCFSFCSFHDTEDADLVPAVTSTACLYFSDTSKRSYNGP